MNRTSHLLPWALVLAALAACEPRVSRASTRRMPALPPDANPFHARAEIPLPRAKGRLDHVAYDAARDRAWVAARESGTIEVVDLGSERHVLSLAGYEEASGIAYLPGLECVAVACGEPGTLEVFDAATGDPLAGVSIGRDADAVRYDPAYERVFVGWGSGAIAVVDARSWKVISAFALTSHPEGFAMAKDGERLFVNLPEERRVVELSRSEKRLRDTWTLDEWRGNYPLLLVDDDARLLIGVRHPPALLTLDAANGAVLAVEPLSADVDDLFEDPERARVYAACGEGYVDVFERKPDGAWRRTARVPTRPGARTARWVPETGRLLVALPADAAGPAEILVLELAR